MKRVETVLSTQQYAEVVEFCKKHGLSVYALLKRAVLDHIGFKTVAPETSEMTDRQASIERVAESLSMIPTEGIEMLLRIIDVMLEVPPVEMVRILETMNGEKSKRSKGRKKRSSDMQKVPLQR